MYRCQKSRYKQCVADDLAPTEGYAADATRFLKEVAPHCEKLGVDPDRLVRSR